MISDTHGLLRPEAEEALRGVDHVLHAGDIGAAGILPRLARIAPLTAIRGNIDKAAWASGLPEEVRLELAGHSLLMLHDRKSLRLDPGAEGIDIVISGHSHKPEIEQCRGVLYFNPGSAGQRRFRLPVTLGFLDLGESPPRAEIRQLIEPPG